jgi:hypothetical protein
MNIILPSSAFLPDLLAPPMKMPAIPEPTIDYAPILEIIGRLCRGEPVSKPQQSATSS